MLHSVDNGAGMTNKMIDYLNSLENITVLFEIPGTGHPNRKGEVIGATANSGSWAKSPSWQRTWCWLPAAAANEDMPQVHPEIVDAYPMVAPALPARGILWGMELGAAVDNMHAYQGYGFYCEGVGAGSGIANRGGIMVNLNTERFCNEYDGYSQIAPHVIAQPKHHVYLIFDEANAQATNLTRYERICSSKRTPLKNCREDRLDGGKLAAVVDAYREGIEKGEDVMNRTKLPDSFRRYYASHMTADLRHTQGGLVTDVAAHVLTEDNEVIQGLYATGGVTRVLHPRAPTTCPGMDCCRRWSLARSPESAQPPRCAEAPNTCPIPARAWTTTSSRRQGRNHGARAVGCDRPLFFAHVLQRNRPNGGRQMKSPAKVLDKEGGRCILRLRQGVTGFPPGIAGRQCGLP